MTVLAAVAVAVAAVAVAAAAVLGRRSAGTLAGERARADDLRAALDEAGTERGALQAAVHAADDRAARAEQDAARATERAAEADGRAAAAEARADEAMGRAEQAALDAAAADARAADAEHRASTAETRAAEAASSSARGPRDVAASGAAAAGAPAQGDGGAGGSAPGAGALAALWELERVRLEREWREIAGPSAALPVPWDGTVGAALAVELELIREVVGTPSRLDVADAGYVDPAVAARVSRLTGELLRCLARTGEELAVTVCGPAEVRVTVQTLPGAPGPDTSALSGLVDAAGGTIDVTAGPPVWEATVRVAPTDA